MQVEEVESAARHRTFKGTMDGIVSVIAIVFTLYHVAYLLGLFSGPLARYGVYIPNGSHRTVTLLFLLVLTFMLVPAWKSAPKDRIVWYDLLLIVMSLPPTLYYFIFYEDLLTHYGSPSLFQQVLAVMLLVVILEATRRVVGIAMPILAVLFILYALFSNYFPGPLEARGYSVARVLGMLYLGNGGIWGIVLDVAATTVVAFVIFGAILLQSGGGKFFIDLAIAAFGRFRGGPAKVAVVSSAMFGMVSGSVAANVATTGTFTIPMMKRVGYKPHTAGAIEAVSSTGGQLMPPVMGAAAFIMAEFLNIPYVAVAIAAAVPAILYYASEYILVDFEAAKLGLRGAPREELPDVRKTLREGWGFILPIGTFIFLLAGLNWAAETSALLSVAVMLVVAFLIKKPRMKVVQLERGLRDGAVGMLDVGAVCASAGVIVGMVGLTGMGPKLSAMLVDISSGEIVILLILTALTTIVLSMGLPSVSCYILVVILVAPALINLGIAPLGAHLFVFYYGLASFITPPLCVGAFVAAGIAGAHPFRTGFEAMRIGAVVYLIPFMFVLRPALLLQGSVPEIAYALLVACAGVLFLTAGLSGYLMKNIGLPVRMLLVAAGVMMFVPNQLFDIAGFAVGLVAIATQVRIRAPRTTAETPA